MLLSLFIISNDQLLDAITINVPKDSGKPREDKLLGGLLSEEFDEGSCLSRYQSSLYRKPSPYEPSQYLVSKLRSYEMLHKRCGPGTEAYKRAAEQLGDDSRSVGECRYIVWVAVHGLGNRIVSLVSTFLYALLTERVLLVDQRTDMKHLFCEPFPVPKDSEKPREDKLLGGLLSEVFDEGSCLSRYQSSLYRKPSPYEPSQYVVSRLRSYEMLHKRCGPSTEAYKRATEQLGHESIYVVWVAVDGLGNRIISLVSAFLYALLTERVLLVDQLTDMRHLFCEPFPGTSWLLPLDFPLMGQLDSSRCYGAMLKTHAINSTRNIPSYLCLYLMHDHDKMYFCERDQNLIRQVPWSTFGYVSHNSLGELKPWLHYQPKGFTAPDPPCIRSTSIDPCHLTPPSHGCDADWGTYSGKVVPFVRECEDREHDGIKLFDEL
ncbi:hypothetical protein F2Q70_00019891 [Brassica cretica]|uniref:Fucosyltransferase n=1 Tax=Brassica cretica TaxID=69181 RepID=A0A8S9GNI3_BRACR|nr:hypothetical protein F2Q70_00019891 [Brassica cretica]